MGSIIALWVGLPSWAKRLIEYAAIAALCLLLLRWYGNKQYSVGAAEGRVSATKEIVKEKEKEWAGREAQLATESTKLQSDRDVVSAQALEVSRARASMKTELSQKLIEIGDVREKNNSIVNSIPASGLDGALRSLSAELDRTTIGPVK